MLLGSADFIVATVSIIFAKDQTVDASAQDYKKVGSLCKASFNSILKRGAAVYFAAFASLVMHQTILADPLPEKSPTHTRASERIWTHQWGAEGPSLIWEHDLGTGFSGLASHEDLVIGTGHEEGMTIVRAIELESGQLRWRSQFESPLDANDFEGGPTATPLVADGVVYVLSRRGTLYAQSLLDGKTLWQKDVVQETGIRIPTWGFAGSPRIFESKLVLNIGECGVCIDKNSGQILWSSEDREAGYSSAVPHSHHGFKSIILGSGRSYVCVELETGKELWRQKWLTTFGCNVADAVVSDDKVFLSSGYSRGSALLDLSSGVPEIIWKHKDFRNHLSTSVLVDGFLYGINGDLDEGATLTCMKWDTGEIQWSSDGFNAGALLVSGDRIIVLSDDGELIISEVSSKEFKVLARSQVLDGRCWVAPLLTDGFLLCRNASGKLKCLNLRQ